MSPRKRLYFNTDVQYSRDKTVILSHLNWASKPCSYSPILPGRKIYEGLVAESWESPEVSSIGSHIVDNSAVYRMRYRTDINRPIYANFLIYQQYHNNTYKLLLKIQ